MSLQTDNTMGWAMDIASRAQRKEKIAGRVAGSWRGEFEARAGDF
jgi:hypothetical protein